jgi:hypothetical protein
MQLIAPVVGPDLPRPEDFFEVPFHDLAADGFSFFAHNKLDCKDLVAQLGAAPETVAVLARVVHQRTHQHFGRPEILVGCQILRRIQVQRLEQSESNADGAAPIQLEFALSP